MKWGFAWEMGPFETWDALGVKKVVARLEGEGATVAPWVKEMLASGKSSFYTYAGAKKLAYDPACKDYVEIDRGPMVLSIADVRRTRTKTAGNEMASLWDIGDGVLLLEWHTRVNALDGPIMEIVQTAVEKLHGNASGLVIANGGKNFAVGANIFAMLLAVQSNMWSELELMIKMGQDIFMGLRTAPKPVVAAPHQMALGRRLRDLPGRRPHRGRRRDLHGPGRSRHRRHSRLGRLQGDGAPPHQPAHECDERQPHALPAPGL